MEGRAPGNYAGSPRRGGQLSKSPGAFVAVPPALGAEVDGSAQEDVPPVAAVIAHELAIADIDRHRADAGQRREWEVSVH